MRSQPKLRGLQQHRKCQVDVQNRGPLGVASPIYREPTFADTVVADWIPTCSPGKEGRATKIRLTSYKLQVTEFFCLKTAISISYDIKVQTTRPNKFHNLSGPFSNSRPTAKSNEKLLIFNR